MSSRVVLGGPSSSLRGGAGGKPRGKLTSPAERPQSADKKRRIDNPPTPTPTSVGPGPVTRPREGRGRGGGARPAHDLPTARRHGNERPRLMTTSGHSKDKRLLSARRARRARRGRARWAALCGELLSLQKASSHRSPSSLRKHDGRPRHATRPPDERGGKFTELQFPRSVVRLHGLPWHAWACLDSALALPALASHLAHSHQRRPHGRGSGGRSPCR